MSTPEDNYRVITDTLSNLKRILLIDDDPAHRVKRLRETPLPQDMIASRSEAVQPVIADSVAVNASIEPATGVGRVEHELEQGGHSSEEVPLIPSSPILLPSSPDIHIELSQEECRMMNNEVAVLKENDALKEDPVLKEEPMVMKEEFEVLISDHATLKESTPLNEELAVLKEPIALKREADVFKEENVALKESTSLNEEPVMLTEEAALKVLSTVLKETTRMNEEPALKEEPAVAQITSREAPQSTAEHPLSIEERMEQILTTMEHQITSSDQARAAFKPPRISPPQSVPPPTLSITRLLFVYINHRGCAVVLHPSPHA